MVTYLFLIQMDFSFNRKALNSFKTIGFHLKKNNEGNFSRISPDFSRKSYSQSKTSYKVKHFFFPINVWFFQRKFILKLN